MTKKILKSLANEAFWVGFGLIASVLAMLAGTRFLTTLLSADEYGKLALAMSLAALAVQIGAEPVSQTAIRFYAYWQEEGKLPAFLRSIAVYVGLVLALVVIIATIVVFLGHWIEGFPGISFIMLVASFASLLVINRVAFSLEDALRERRMRALLQGLFEIGRFLMAAGLILVTSGKNAVTVLFGFVLAGLMVVIAHTCFLRRSMSGVFSGQDVKNTGRDDKDKVTLQGFLLPLIASHACIWIVMMAERWALQYYGDLAEVGGYAAVYQLAFMPMILISNFVLLLTTPIIYQIVGAGKNPDTTYQALRTNRHVAFIMLACTLSGFGVLVYLHPAVGQLLLGPEFRKYSWMFPWLLLAGGCFAAAHQLLLKLTCEFRTQSLALLWGALAIVAVAAYFSGARLWQLQGLITSVVGVNGLLLLFALIITFRVQEKG